MGDVTSKRILPHCAVEKTNEMKGEGKGLKNEDNGRNKIEKNLSFPPNIHRVVTMIEYLSLSGSGVAFRF